MANAVTFRDEHYYRATYDRRPCRFKPVHPSEVAKNRPPHAAAGLKKSRLPIPVVSRSADPGVRSSKVPQANLIATTSRNEKSRIPVLANQLTIHAPRIEALNKRESEVMAELLNIRAERERVKSLQLKLLVHKPTPVKKRRSKSLALDKTYVIEKESPNIVNMSPLLLSPAHSKSPSSFDENDRTFNFFQTPPPTKFKRFEQRTRLLSDNGLQRQLVKLYS